MRLAGHTLVSEGAPHDSDGARINIYHPMWQQPAGGRRLGCGLCSCGAISAWEQSDAARKRWHQEHKAAAVSGVPAPTQGDPMNDVWRPGDPCVSCGSTDTSYAHDTGAHCGACGRSDSDE